MPDVPTTAATEHPVTLTEAKAHLRVEHDSENAYIFTLIAAATDEAERWTRRQFVTATWDEYLDAFPDTILVKHPPLQSVTEIKYVDTEGVPQTLADTLYTVDAHSFKGRIVPAFGLSWPSVRSVVNAVQLTYKAGYGDDAADVPAAIREAILLRVGGFYLNHEDVVIGTIATELPLASRCLLRPFRVVEAA